MTTFEHLYDELHDKDWDLGQVKCIKDEKDKVLVEKVYIKQRW